MQTVENKAQIAPGPWGFDGCGVNCADEYATRVLTLPRTRQDDPAWIASAKLAAAAPDLLAALKLAQGIIDKSDLWAKYLIDDDDIEMINAAIAKAEGR